MMKYDVIKVVDFGSFLIFRAFYVSATKKRTDEPVFS